jgi:hypothetical protein
MLNKVPSVGAWKDGTLIGFTRAVSDGKFRVIEDFVIHNSYRKEGIGTKMVQIVNGDMYLLVHVNL